MLPFKRRIIATACSLVMAGSVHAASTIDLVVAMDESGSMSGEQDFIGTYVKNMDTILTTQGVSTNQFGLAGFGGSSSLSGVNQAGLESGSAGYRHFFMTMNPNALLGTSTQFDAVTPQLVVNGGTEDGYRSIDYILRQYVFRSNAGASILLITDEDRDNDTSNMVTTNLPAGQTQFDRTIIQNLLTQRNMVLHAVIGQRLTDKDGNTAIAVVGKDPATGFAYVKNAQGVVEKRVGYLIASGDGTTTADYTDLALQTGGTVADLRELRPLINAAQNNPNDAAAQAALAAVSTALAEVIANIAVVQQTVSGGDDATKQAVKSLIKAAGRNGRALVRVIGGRIGDLRDSGRLRADLGTMSFAGRDVSISSDSLRTGKGGAAGAGGSDISFFVRGSIGDSRFDAVNGIPGYKGDLYTLAVGADTKLTPQVIVGAALGYAKSESDVDGLVNTGVEADIYSLSAYGSWEFQPKWYLDFVAGYGELKMDTRRTAGAVGVTGRPKGELWNLSLGFSTDYKLGGDLRMQPFARFHHMSLKTKSYTETDNTANPESKVNALSSEIGATVLKDFGSGWTGRASLAWEHDFDPDAFFGEPVPGVARTTGTRDYARVGVGVAKDFGGDRALLIRFDSVVGHGEYRENTLEFKYRQAF